MAVIMDIVPPNLLVPDKKHRNYRRWLAASGAGLAIVIVALCIWQLVKPAPSLIPAAVRKGAGFTIYYPAQQRLPAGYTLETTSFRLAQPGVVVYSVSVGPQRWIFSEEKSPGSDIINKFLTSYMPLHTEVATSLGKAETGAAGQGTHMQTIISLPVTHGPWVIITAPADVSPADVRQILQSLTM